MAATTRFLVVIFAAIGVEMFAATAGAEASAAIDELFSTANGKLQFIQLTNVSPSQLAGMSLTTTHDGISRTFVFPATSHMPNAPFINQVLVVSQTLSQRSIDSAFTGGSEGGADQWDYVVPDGFVPMSGGTISLGNIDRWEYGRIPVDGVSALYRSGGIGVYEANSSAAGHVAVFGIGEERYVSEYTSDSLDRHFFTPYAGEIAALNAGSIAGWHWIGRDFPNEYYTTFGGYGRSVEVMSHPVCRFYLPPPDASHFFTASQEECAEVQVRFPQFVLETDRMFYAGLPDPGTGACAPGLGPLYRLWNPTSNHHWFMADLAVRQRAIALGYLPEGYGPDGVGMCVLLACGVEC
jgi:hypothetical protein